MKDRVYFPSLSFLSYVSYVCFRGRIASCVCLPPACLFVCVLLLLLLFLFYVEHLSPSFICISLKQLLLCPVSASFYHSNGELFFYDVKPLIFLLRFAARVHPGLENESKPGKTPRQHFVDTLFLFYFYFSLLTSSFARSPHLDRSSMDLSEDHTWTKHARRETTLSSPHLP